MNSTFAQTPTEVHEPHWVSRAAFPVLLGALAVNQAALVAALLHHWMWVAALLVQSASHFMHGLLIAFHEASHGLLRKNRRINEVDGFLLGIFSFMSFSLYRAAHQSHHAHLATERDEELWPFTVPGMARWKRVLAAVLELFFGIFFTPYLFLRTFLREGSPIRNQKLRRRIWKEFAGMAVIWAAIIGGVALAGAWHIFLWTFVAPAFIAGNLQSWRKYIEHVGLTGDAPNSETRSIVSDTFWGRVVAFTLLHEPYHGVHHLHSGLTHAELPLQAAKLNPQKDGDPAPFPSYRHAFMHLLRNLSDPRVGTQWRRAPELEPAQAEESRLSPA